MSQPTYEIDLFGEAYNDKVWGCWQGKNAGGTLGTPLETAYGSDELYDVWWYPELKEGGLPNDDLEMQLAWLKAAEEVGPELTARDMARYWLDHIGYNFDEYGLSKQNLRLGLEPPVSGHYNNWFIDCMGSPIRSEIWACLAPGAPRGATRLALQDALCDHAGGEGVYGELVQRCARVGGDLDLVLDYGDGPVVRPGTPRQFAVVVENPRAEAVEVTARVRAPEGWDVSQAAPVRLDPGQSAELSWTITCPSDAVLETSNAFTVDLEIKGRPRPSSIPFALVGAHAYTISAGDHEQEWRVDGNDLRLADLGIASGALRVRHMIESPDARTVWCVIDANRDTVASMNGVELLRRTTAGPLRPNLSGAPGSGFAAELRAGANQLEFELHLDSGSDPLECHVLLSSNDRFHDGQYDLGRTRLSGETSRP